MEKLYSKLYDASLANKRVIVRVDFNVPLKPNGMISDYFRLLETLPTLELIKKRGGTSIILTHWGQPTEKTPTLSTQKFIPWLQEHGFSVRFAPTPQDAQKKEFEKPCDIILMENLRFFPGEKNQDESFAQQLASLGSYFVQDAFGALHRDDTSITLLPKLFHPDKRTIGLLVEKEIQTLSALLAIPTQPLVLTLGGNKIETKLPLIRHFLGKAQSILLCPALVFTFLKARGFSIGRSFFDPKMILEAKDILKEAETSTTELVFPVDYLVTENSFEKPYPLRISKSLSGNMVGISVGPTSIHLFKKKLLEAKTIFLNGLMGNPNFTETLEATKSLLHSLHQTSATKIIGGGDSISTARALSFSKDLAFFSTGGGATLKYLSGRPLIGLTPFY